MDIMKGRVDALPNEMHKKKNIFIFMTDHQRVDMAPPFHKCLTPNLDMFMQEAVAFTNMTCPSPHCCPSRATFFSGLYPSQHGVWNNVMVGNTLSRGLAANVRLFSEDLRDAGYRLFFSGKWHLSNEEGPESRGFETVYHKQTYTGIQSAAEARIPDCSEWAYYERPLCTEDTPRGEGEIVRPGYPRYALYGTSETPFDDEQVVRAAEKHIGEVLPGVEDPWCYYVGPLGPHDPYFVPQRFLDMYDIAEIELPDNYHDDMMDKPELYRKTRDRFAQLTDQEHREAIRHFLAFCTYEDYLFGRMISALKKAGLYEDSIILYTSDHGDYVGAHGLWTKGLPCFMEAYRIPFLLRIPGGKHNEVSDVPALLADAAPTILELAGIQVDRPMTGVSLVPYVLGGQLPARREYRFTQSNGNELYGIQRSVFNENWKYVFNGFGYDELYDLKNDPGELHNLAFDSRYRDVIRQMVRELWRFARQTQDTYINPYIMIAHMPYGPGILLEEERT